MKRRVSFVVASVYLITMLTILSTGIAAYAQQVITAPYFPLSSGSWWQYRRNGTEIYVKKVLDERVVVNGVPTWVMTAAEGNDYMTNDTLGIRQHRLKENADGFMVTFIPPVDLLPPLATLGQPVNSNGTARWYDPSFGTFDIKYSVNSLPLAVESVAVPYGTFDSLKVKISFRLCGIIHDETIDEMSIQYIWLVKNIGRVKMIEYYEGKVEEEVLLDSNLPLKRIVISPLHLLLLKK